MGFPALANNAAKAARRALGEPILYRDADGIETNIRGVWSAPYVGVDTAQGTIASRRPTVGVRLADLPEAPERGDEVQRGADWYRVESVEEDGQGNAELILKRATGRQ